MTYKDIEGWFDYENLYDECVAIFSGGIFVEVGSWLGCSAAYMAESIKKSGKPIKFFAVDTWKGSENDNAFVEILARCPGDPYDIFLTNMKKLNVQDFVQPIKKFSVDAAKQFENESVDFIFIDAAHDYESVKSDIQAWYPKLKMGGIIAGHDWGASGVVGAVKELLPKSQIFLKGPSRSCWYYRHFEFIS